MGEAALKIEHEPNLRAQFAERITAAWHKSREKIIALGIALIEARQQLEYADFEAMIERDLPFGPDHARRIMRIAADPRLSCASKHTDLPQAIEAMDELRKLDDTQFEGAIASGTINPNMTVLDARAYVRSVKGSSTHRPRHSEIAQPASPAGSMSTAGAQTLTARSYSEMVWLLVQRRMVLGLTQLDLDARIGWGDGMTSKLEIPHTQEGRVAGPGTLKDWLQALGVGLQVVVV